MRIRVFVALIVLVVAALAIPAGAQEEQPQVEPDSAKAEDEAIAQDSPEDALRVLGRQTFVLEQSQTGATTQQNRGGALMAGDGVTITPVDATRVRPSSQPGVAVAASGNPQSGYLLQSLEGGRGVRAMVTISGPDAPTSFKFDLSIPRGAFIAEAADGSVGIGQTVNGEDVLSGTIAAPWAIDADGNDLPVTQKVSEKGIKLAVNTANVTSWPVVADPSYHYFGCPSSSQYGNAWSYAYGHVCPGFFDSLSIGYFPVWIEHFGLWRVGRQSGNCGDWIMPDRLNIWGWGVVYDWRQACKVHDYLYDLRRHLNYPYVSRLDSDNIFRDLMEFDCSHRTGSIWYPSPQQDCALFKDDVYRSVRWFGS